MKNIEYGEKMKEKQIPINKGNYSMDTIERKKNFDKYRAQGWEDEYYEYRRAWEEYPHKQIVEKYPLNIDIELSTICNLKCPMCYTITEEFKDNVPAKFMEYQLFKKIIDEISGKVPAVRLSLRGESTLVPEFIECIKYAKEKGIGEVSTLTNGSQLTEEFIKKIVLAGLDWLTISIDGVGDEYEKIRYPMKFDDILTAVKNIKKIKTEYGLKKPVIKIQSIWPAIKNNTSLYYNTFVDYVDLIAFNPLVKYDEQLTNIKYVENFVCPQIYQRMVVMSDGRVSPCCVATNGEFIMGDAKNETIYDIWHGDKYSKFRKIMNEKDGFRKFDRCKTCLLPRQTETKHIGIVNGREFKINDYI